MKNADDKAAVRKHIEEIFEAYVKKDREALRSHHAGNWVGYTLNSRRALVGIEEYVSNAERILKTFDFEGYEVLEFQVEVHGDTAVVPYNARLWGNGSGQAFDIKIRVLDVYMKRGGKWNQIASNVSFHPQTIDAIMRGV